MIRLITLAVFSFTLAGCVEDEPRFACTLIGCNSGLTIQVTNPPAAPYRIEVYPAGSSTRVGRDCTGGPCTAFFQDFTAARAFVQVIVASDTTTREVQPTYIVSRPNGPACDPECRSATVTLAL